MNKTKTKPKSIPPITKLYEYGMWLYCLSACDAAGRFHQKSEQIAKALKPLRVNIHERNIQRALRRLVKTGHLIEISPQTFDKNGWKIPATYEVVGEFMPNGMVRIAKSKRVVAVGGSK